MHKLDWLYLSMAILGEIIATSALKAAAGFTRPGPTTLVLLGYGTAFYCLSQALRTIPMGVAYALWSGIGIVVISLIGFVLYRQRLDGAAMLGMGLIVAGTLVINLFSQSARHG